MSGLNINDVGGATATILADEVGEILLNAVEEIGELPLFRSEERLVAAIVKGLERARCSLPRHGQLNDEDFAELLGRVGLLVPKLPSRSSALVPQIRQLVAAFEAMRVQATMPEPDRRPCPTW